MKYKILTNTINPIYLKLYISYYKSSLKFIK